MYDAETLAALLSGQLVLRDFLLVFGWESDGDPVTFAFWTGEDDVTVNVVSAQDGTLDSHNYVGGGALPPDGVPAIQDVVGIEARAVEFQLNHLHPAIETMLRASNVRVAKVELHRGVFDPSTWSLVSEPFPRFLGRVDSASIDTAAIGGEGSASLTAVASTIDLTRTNPAMKSDEQQRLRSGDRFRRYADTAAQIEVDWGQKKGAA